MSYSDPCTFAAITALELPLLRENTCFSIETFAWIYRLYCAVGHNDHSYRNKSLMTPYIKNNGRKASSTYTRSTALTATCPACLLEPETVQHYLLSCPRFAVERTRHFRRLGRRSLTLSYLLNTKGALKPLFAYINDTGRLRGIRFTRDERQRGLMKVLTRR